MDPDRPHASPEIIRLDEVASASDLLLEKAEEGAEEHTLVIAGEQTGATAGSGALAAPPGGLWGATLWCPEARAEEAALVTLAGAWGLREGIRAQTGVAAGLKWPNDLIANGAKLGGVAVEGRVLGHEITHAAIGFGVNVNNPVHQLPDELPRVATSLQAETGEDVDLEGLTEAVTEGLREARDLLDTPDELVSKVTSCWTQKGAKVAIDAGYTLLQGTALRIAADGALVLSTEEGEGRVDDPSLAKFVRIL